MLSALYSGHVYIWDYSSNTLVKSFELCEVPVRCAKFIVRKQWFIAATDDMYLRVYSYNTMEKIKEWEAHTDYIRFVEVHPNRPYVISSSDDMSIKIWDWERNFECIQIFEGHMHYVMMVKVFFCCHTTVVVHGFIDDYFLSWHCRSILETQIHLPRHLLIDP